MGWGGGLVGVMMGIKTDLMSTQKHECFARPWSTGENSLDVLHCAG